MILHTFSFLGEPAVDIYVEMVSKEQMCEPIHRQKCKTSYYCLKVKIFFFFLIIESSYYFISISKTWENKSSMPSCRWRSYNHHKKNNYYKQKQKLNLKKKKKHRHTQKTKNKTKPTNFVKLQLEAMTW